MRIFATVRVIRSTCLGLLALGCSVVSAATPPLPTIECIHYPGPPPSSICKATVGDFTVVFPVNSPKDPIVDLAAGETWTVPLSEKRPYQRIALVGSGESARGTIHVGYEGGTSETFTYQSDRESRQRVVTSTHLLSLDPSDDMFLAVNLGGGSRLSDLFANVVFTDPTRAISSISFSALGKTQLLAIPLIEHSKWTDVNGDLAVDALDASRMFAEWGGRGHSDFLPDGIVDAGDAGMLFEQWTGDSFTLPEPSAAGACLATLFGLFCAARRRYATGVRALVG